MKKNLTIYPSNNQGFTLIEVIAVLIILGTVSAIVISKTGNFASGNDVIMEAEILKYNLRYAQMKAMNSKDDEIWQITFPDASSYVLQQYNSVTSSWDNEDLPGQTSATHTFASNISATAYPTSRYNNWGTPVQNDRTTAETANLTITVSDGTNSRSLIVTKNTGFTHLP